MEGSRTGKIVSGLGWSFGERILAQGVTFAISVVLARILSPEEYGIISLVLVFINLANVFVANGFGEALVQKKNVEDKDFSTIFWCMLSFSCLLYFLLFFVSPLIGDFYNDSEIIWILRVLALKLPLSSISTMQHAYVSRAMQFRKFFFSTLWGTLISGLAGITMAYIGYGVWALVAQYLMNSLIDVLVLFITVPWHPKAKFNKSSAKRIMDYAWKITGAAFINELYIEIRTLIIGKVYSSADLAYYNRGNQIPSLFITNINASISTVFFPVMSTLQDNLVELKQLARKTLKISSFLIFPLMTGLFGISRTLIVVILTEKWLPCVPFLQILCIYWMTQPLQIINWQLMKAIGRSDLCLKLEIIKKIIGFVLIVATMFISVEALACSTTAFAIISMIINMIPNRKLVGYSFKQQIGDVLPNLMTSMVMGFIVWGMTFIPGMPVIVILGLQVAVGAVIYLGAAKVFRIEAFSFLMNYFQGFLSRWKKQ